MFQVQPLSQMDPRWKDKILGNDKTTTIGKYGCLLTCLAMAANGYGAFETPDTLNDKMKAAKGFQGALVVPAILPSILPVISFLGFQPCRDYPAPLGDIDAALAANRPVVIELDYSPAPGLQSHWVILLDKQDDDYLIQDPWPYPVDAGPVLLSERFGFAGHPAQIIQSVVWLDGGVRPLAKPVPVPIPTTGLVIYPIVDSLALRQGPAISNDNLVTRIPIGVKLYPTEDPSMAKSKLGKQGQWIKVIESQQGYPGYVAAWYVSTDPQPPPDSQEPPIVSQTPTLPVVPPSDSLIVYAQTDSLALRSIPAIRKNSLIKREPINAQFLVLEDPKQAAVKLGVPEQWIQVKDIEGDQGFVAAWYVSRLPHAALGASIPGPIPVGPRTKASVRSIAENLALRTQPDIYQSSVVRRYPLGSEFLVIEPSNQAIQKIGKTNQWLQVQAIDGQQGYLAAWYVIQRPFPGMS